MEYDYVVVGGGIAGCVLASRLHEKDPKLSIVLLEAGEDVSHRPEVEQGSYARLLNTDIDWGYTTVPQRHLQDRELGQNAGKGLGGSSIINACGWTRGDKSDYDAWGALVKSSRWSYAGFLPYFRKTERHHDANADPSTHGLHGPVIISSASSTGRQYPLRKTVQDAWGAVGLERIDDMNNGNPIGLGEMNDNRRDGKRQVAPSTYPLDGVVVKLKSHVERVLIETKASKAVAVGIKLLDRTELRARREVILSAGAYRTPQILLLSGIGAIEELKEHSIDCLVNSPEVGRNFHDHICVSQFWKLRNPELGLSMGHPKFGGPNYEKGLPSDFVATMSVPREDMKKALSLDLGHDAPASHPMLAGQLSNLESYVVYAAANAANPQIPFDGSHITTSICLMLPTSRGSIKLKDADARSPPVIDPNYFATEADRFALRWGLKRVAQVMLKTKEMQQTIFGETMAEGKPSLSPSSSDEDLDDLVQRSASTLYHPAGSCAMGKVVNADLRVHGIEKLRVVDASVFPFPLGSHYQACIYALAEQAADILLQ